MKRIESIENPFIKKVISLKQKKFRDKESLYLTEGLRISADILGDTNKKHLVKTLILTETREALLKEEPFKDFFDQTVIISEKLSGLITDTVTEQGVFLIMHKEKPDILEKIKNYSRVLILDNLSDPGNTGTIIRTALGAGFEGVISLKGSVDLYSPKVVRSTMGAINKIDTYEGADQKEIIKTLSVNGFKIFSGDLKGDRTIYDDFPEEKIALILGSEAHGVQVPEELIDGRITVPMLSQTESLNVSVAAGLLMYAVNRRKFDK